MENTTCPNCGYCPHCGRGGQQTYPHYPTYPWYPTGPIWIAPVWTGGYVGPTTTGVLTATNGTADATLTQ